MRPNSVWIFLLALSAALHLRPLEAQRQPMRISVGANVRVSAASDERPLVEPQLTSLPGKPNHLLATAMSVRASSIADSDCATFVSLDSGTTWSRHDHHVAGCADPWVALREDGVAVFAALSTSAGNALYLARSADGGRTWAPVSHELGSTLDHESMVVDLSGGPRSGSIYLVAQGHQRTPAGRNPPAVVITRSIDGGRTFMPRVSVIPGNLNINVLTPGVSSSGTLVVPYMDFQSNITDFRSRAGELERKRVWVIASTDGGQTFSHPSFVTEACGLGFGALAVDLSPGPTRDHVYYVCANREQDGILVHRSVDGGEKWSRPVRADDSTAAAFRRPPSIAVGRDGTVVVSWTHRRLDRPRACQDVYVTASVDGGQTFLPVERVSAVSSCPETPGNDRVARRWPEGGDYSGLVATADGRFQVLWADSRDGVYRLWTAPITIAPVAR